MNMEFQDGESHLEKLDADAVCIQCGTVNAEGTLLCKVCGNNLRDQRNRRLATDQELEAGPSGPKLRNWLSPVFFVLAVALILSTLYNQEMIVDWLMSGSSSAQDGPAGLWRGQLGEKLDQLSDDLSARLPSQEEAMSAYASPDNSSPPGGIYALFVEDEFVGFANMLLEGDILTFTARLESGEDLRGRATFQGNYYIMPPDRGGLTRRRGYTPVQGVATLQSNGVIECVGDDGQARYSCYAYRVGS